MYTVAATVCTSICFELCCLIVGESFFPAHPAERCALFKWEGEGDVAYDVFAVDELHSTALGKGRI